MNLFLRAHRAPVGLAAATTLSVLAWWLAEQSIPMPALLTGRTEPIPFHLLFATLFAPLTAHLYGGAPMRFERAARRRLLGGDLLLAGLLLAPAAVVCATAAGAGDGGFALAFGRNVALNLAVALPLVAIRGQTLAATVPLGYFIIAGTLGGSLAGWPQWWAVIRWPGDPIALVASLIGLLVGLGWFHYQARVRVTR